MSSPSVEGEESEENSAPKSYLDPVSDGIGMDDVKITGEAVARSWWRILLEIVFGGW